MRLLRVGSACNKMGNSYEYVAVYVDDLAFTMKESKKFVNILENKYRFKLKGTGPLKSHLGTNFERDKHGVRCMSPKKYIDRMVDNYARIFGGRPTTNVSSPLKHGDHLELDDSELLDEEGIQMYQSLVGSLQWSVSLGCFDIACALMIIYCFRVAPYL